MTTRPSRRSSGRLGRLVAVVSPARWSLRAALVLVIALVVAACGSTTAIPTTTPVDVAAAATASPASAAPLSAAVKVLAAGDIAGCDGNEDEKTARLIDSTPGTVLALGDNAYESGSASEYRRCYEPTWGRFRDRTKPAPGNHEYRTAGAAGYFGYFGPAAGDPTRGYYAFTLGAWRVYSLNSNCDHVGGCAAGSPQERWLRDDLAAHPSACILAYWHHPRFSSGILHGSDPRTDGLWRALAAAGADVILSGHDHDYERFAPQDANGRPSASGIREFVVGTGGSGLRPFGKVLPTSVVRNASTHGILELTLRPGGYDWSFVPVDGRSFHDAGTGTC